MPETTKKSEPLDPNEIVRLGKGPKYFGLRLTQQAERIKNDPEFPKPFALGGAGSRARGWFGYQINAWHELVRERAAEWEAARKIAQEPKAAQPATRPVKRR